MNAMQFVGAHPAVLVVAIGVFVVFGIAYRPVWYVLHTGYADPAKTLM